ncbi:MAG TPA: DNA polymerase III subunit delta [Verrucomicrobiales bacterium]|nr:DNA polymerase III subunit delta [Verrucomicrobiales bacterium]
MPAKAAAPRLAPLMLIFGEDDFGVLQRGREIFREWEQELGGMDHETIDAGAANSGEALNALSRLREALNTLPFFGGGKAIWFKGCSFLGDDRTSASAAVTEGLADLAALLKDFKWGEVRLVITAGKTDKRKTFFKTLQKTGGVEEFSGWSSSDKDWVERGEMLARQAFKDLGKSPTDDALAQLVQSVGPLPRQLQMEVEKISLYVGGQPVVSAQDVAAVCIRNKQAQAFALAEALGDRDLPAALKILDEELWSMQFDRKKSEIGLLYGLITKVRMLLMAQELIRSGRLKVVHSYPSFKAQVERLNPEDFPRDRRFSPLGVNPFVLFKAMPQARNYGMGELVRAMELLLESNRRLVASGQEERMVLQQTLVEILSRPVGHTPSA